jgi:hypothetical protein
MTMTRTEDAPAAAAAAEEHAEETRRLGRLALATFIFTFVTSRILVIFIMDGKLPPELFFHVHGTHVHHLNYGIFLLSFTGAYLIFARPVGSRLTCCTILYAIGLALTFDEFSMWLHLGGPYWQRASYDAVITVALLLALIAFGSQIRHWRPKHYTTVVALAVLLVVFGFVLHRSMKWAHQTLGAKLYQLEEHGPS